MSDKIGVYSEATAREVLRRCHIQASSAPSEGLSGPDGQSTRPVPLGEPWLGIITALGPASQADYTGPQYWVETAAITNARGSNPPNTTLPTLAAQSYPNESTRWVTATNLAEVPGASHLLTAGALVMVAEAYGLDESPYYVFEMAPPSSGGDVMYARWANTSLAADTGVTPASGDTMLLISATGGHNAGLYTYNGSAYTYASSPNAVVVGHEGGVYGGLTFTSVSTVASAAYVAGGYAWA
jgi:hypothetical protein